MNNACVVMKKRVEIADKGVAAVLDAFCVNGYSFEEIRILPQADEMRVKEAIKALKDKSETILFLADKTALSVARQYISGIFGEVEAQGMFGGAGIYSDNKCTLFLLSADDTETGVQ